MPDICLEGGKGLHLVEKNMVIFAVINDSLCTISDVCMLSLS